MELVLLCIKVFLGRMVDVSLSTLQTMYLVKGKRSLATIVGFIDVLIWFIVVTTTRTKKIFLKDVM